MKLLSDSRRASLLGNRLTIGLRLLRFFLPDARATRAGRNPGSNTSRNVRDARQDEEGTEDPAYPHRHRMDATPPGRAFLASCDATLAASGTAESATR